jgi:putative ABC transport system permease protein
MIWTIAWKNIWRNKLRSIIVISAITLGLLSGMYSSAIMLGMYAQRLETSINREVSHIQIHNPKYNENKEIQYSIDNEEEVRKFLSKMPEIKAISYRTKIMGMINSPTSASGIQILGVNPEEERKVSTLYKTICDTCGSYFKGVSRNPIVLSLNLTEKLKVRLHSKIVLRFQDVNGMLTEGAFKIAGQYKTNNTIFDEMNVFVRKADLSAMTGNKEKTHEIAILLHKDAEPDVVKEKIKAKFPELSVMTWKEIQPDLGYIIDIMDIYLYFILGIILLALSFGIINTMLMVVLERVRELGMLMAIGMNRLRIFRMIMLETILLSLTGGIIGMVLSSITISLSHSKGINLAIFKRGIEYLGYDSVIYPYITFDYYIGLTILVIITGIISSLYPARRALKLNPAEAVRTD